MRIATVTLLALSVSFYTQAQWTTNGSGDAYNNNSSGKVGIGTSTPGYTLDVAAPANTWKARFQGPDGYIVIGPANSGAAHIYTDRSSFIFNQPIWSYLGAFSSYQTNDLTLQTNGTTRMTISSANGNVGIGTSTPGARFTVALPGYTGTPSNSSLMFVSQSTNPNGTDLQPALELSNGGGQGYGLVSNATNNYLSGNLGIGVKTPSQKLDVNGNINMAGVAGRRIYMGGAGGSTFGIAYDANNPNYGLFYTEGSPDYISLSPNGNATSGVMNLYGDGRVAIGTTSTTTANLQVGQSTANGLVSLGGYAHVGSLGSSGDFFAGMNAYAQYNSGDENRIKVLLSNSYGFSAMQMSYNGDISFYTKNGTVTANDQINVASNTAMKITGSGNVGIGTSIPDARLAVKGQVHAQEVKVDLTVPGPDYVFEKDYKLTSLEEIKNYIDQTKHLPEVPSAKEMEKNGVQLGEMNMLLLKKIEELTLYVIELNKKMAEMRTEINQRNTKP